MIMYTRLVTTISAINPLFFYFCLILSMKIKILQIYA